jgi:hypothetical protein
VTQFSGLPPYSKKSRSYFHSRLCDDARALKPNIRETVLTL